MLLKLGLVTLLLSPLYLTGSLVNEQTTDYSCEETVAFIESNFDYFRLAMRGNAPDASSFDASYIEEEIVMGLTDSSEEAAYLDFDGDNGYAVIGKNLEVFLLVPTGQIVVDASRGSLIYSRYDGLGYTRSGIPFEPLGEEASSFDWTGAQSGTHYAGQESGAEGSGKIIRPVEYVAAKYGSGYENYEIRVLQSWYFQTQKVFSLYARRNDDGTTSYEGNCLLASLYKNLDYIRSTRSASLPSDTVQANLSNDSFYASFMSQTTSDGYPRYSVYHSECPRLYKEIRDYFRDNDSYTFDSAHPSKASDCVAYINGLHATAFTTTLVTSWSFENEVEAAINNIQKYQIWNQVYGTYPNHSMPVVGYSLFRKTTGWWIFTHTDYVKLMGVNDNLIDQERFIDLGAYQSEDGSVGSFVSIAI
jgi:hypothetical protein